MSANAALNRILTQLPGLVAIVGDRIHPTSLPPDAVMPALTYTVVSDVITTSHDGDSGLARIRWQFDCLAGQTDAGVPDQDTATSIAHELRKGLNRAQGAHDGSTLRGFMPAGTGRDMPDPLTNRGRYVIDFTAWHHEEIP